MLKSKVPRGENHTSIVKMDTSSSITAGVAAQNGLSSNLCVTGAIRAWSRSPGST